MHSPGSLCPLGSLRKSTESSLSGTPTPTPQREMPEHFAGLQRRAGWIREVETTFILVSGIRLGAA